MCIRDRPRRYLPFDVIAQIDLDQPTFAEGIAWIEPFPDELIASAADGPDAVMIAGETIELAFLAAIQHLPPKQRAVLVLRDVLGWPASDVAELLDTTETAVKSQLQRARPTLHAKLSARRTDWAPQTQPDPAERVALQRYMDAHERDDVDALVELLLEDVRVAYPQMGIWCDARDSFISGSRKFAPPGEYRLLRATTTEELANRPRNALRGLTATKTAPPGPQRA